MTGQGKTTPASRILGAILLFCLGFLGCAGLIHTALPAPLRLHADMRSEKLVLLDQMRGSVYSAAFGSSRVHNGFNPVVFDREMAQSPGSVQTSTLNLGIEGGSQSEQRQMALTFLSGLHAPPHGGSCLMLLELNAGANFPGNYLVHPRSINLYDWPTFRLETRFAESGADLKQKLGRLGFAAAATVLHYVNLGMLSNHIFAPPLDQAQLAEEMRADRHGLVIPPYSVNDQPSLQQYLAPHPAPRQDVTGEISPGATALVEQLAAASPVRGLSFVYFVLPRAGDLSGTAAYPDHLQVGAQAVPILDLAQPDRYAQFYHLGLWHDVGHLNGPGGDLVSHVLADQLKRWYAVHGPPPACVD